LSWTRILPSWWMLPSGQCNAAAQLSTCSWKSPSLSARNVLRACILSRTLPILPSASIKLEIHIHRMRFRAHFGFIVRLWKLPDEIAHSAALQTCRHRVSVISFISTQNEGAYWNYGLGLCPSHRGLWWRPLLIISLTTTIPWRPRESSSLPLTFTSVLPSLINGQDSGQAEQQANIAAHKAIHVPACSSFNPSTAPWQRHNYLSSHMWNRVFRGRLYCAQQRAIRHFPLIVKCGVEGDSF